MSGISFSRYSAWDGRQAIGALTPEETLEALADEFLSGDIDQALNNALYKGLEDPDGNSVQGLDQLRERLRQETEQQAQEFVQHEGMSEFLDALSQNTSEGDPLSADSNSLIEALHANPNAASRITGGADSETRQELSSMLESFGGEPGEGAEPGEMGTGMAELVEQLQNLLELAELKDQLRKIRTVADVDEVDEELLKKLLGAQAAEQFARLAASLSDFAESGYIQESGKKKTLSSRAIQHLGNELLQSALEQLQSSARSGDHNTENTGSSLERSGTTREYRFGDPFELDLSQTVLQAVKRDAGTPVRLQVEDMTIFERENTSRMATALAIDLSRSMGERGYLLAAKRLALAMSTLIHTKFPRDELVLISFSETAKQLETSDLVDLTWDRYGVGTNVQDALRLARVLLSRHKGLQRNLILITDGEPTAYRDVHDAVQFTHPPTQETLASTYAEAERVKRDQISLSIALLSDTDRVVKFAEDLAKRANGTLILTDPDDLSPATLLGYGRGRSRR